MTSERLFWSLIALLIVMVLGLFGGVYLLSGMRKTKSQDLSTKRQELATLTAQQNGVAKAKSQIQQYNDLYKITKAIVPQDKDQAETVRQITTIAAANGVSLNSITFPMSDLGTTKGAAGGATNNLSQLVKVPAIPGVYNQQITISNSSDNTVSFDQLGSFLRGLENNRRTAEVGSLSIQPQRANPGQLTFTLVVNNYIKPAS